MMFQNQTSPKYTALRLARYTYHWLVKQYIILNHMFLWHWSNFEPITKINAEIPIIYLECQWRPHNNIIISMWYVVELLWIWAGIKRASKTTNQRCELCWTILHNVTSLEGIVKNLNFVQKVIRNVFLMC